LAPPEMPQRIPRLYVVTDRQQTAGRPLPEVIAAAVRGGVGMVQLREKDLCARDLCALGACLRDVLSSHNIPLLINDRLDVAQALDTAGAHLAGHSLPTALARRVLGPHKLLGVSTHSVEEACAAVAEGADFIVFGPVFDTPSKAAYGAPQGLQRLQEVIRHVTIPVLAIGGIDCHNLPQVLQTGAHGVAMIRAILAAPDACAATQQLRSMLPPW
jgi:thiamine-phosphate pyrophosphorylase